MATAASATNRSRATYLSPKQPMLESGAFDPKALSELLNRLATAESILADSDSGQGGYGLTGVSTLLRDSRIALQAMNSEYGRTLPISSLSGESRPIPAQEPAETGTNLDSERLSLLLKASNVLAESLTCDIQLQQLANLIVPTMADWCAIDTLSDGDHIIRRAANHIVSDKTPFIFQMQPLDIGGPELPIGIYQVLHGSQPVLHPDIPEQYWESNLLLPDTFERLRQVGMVSAMVVPMAANGHTLGAITFAFGPESKRRYGEADLAFAIDLAQRAGLLVEKTQQYEETKKMNVELNQRIAQKNLQLEDSIQELDSLSFSLSHDLRRPLRAIDGFSRMVLRDYGAHIPAEGQRRLNIVRENANQLGNLIDDLVAFSRLNRRALQKEAVSPGEIVRAVLQELSAVQENRQIQITVGDLPLCEADPEMLKQVYSNLLSNAIKFTQKQPAAQIEVGARVDKGQTIYFVRDNGVGFDMAYTDQLFTMFDRLHSSQDYDGSGVGLAIVKRVINRHMGRVWAEALPNQGATFFFTLGQ